MSAGYVVVTRSTGEGRFVKVGALDYEHYTTLNDAADRYVDYENGEYPAWEAVGIFPVDSRGLPNGPPLSPATLMELTHETKVSA